MKQIIQEIAAIISDKFENEIEKLLSEERDISEFINTAKAMLDGIGTKLVAEALETVDQAVRDSQSRKRNWLVKSKADPKKLATIFGEVSYKRTYYENKRTGEYSYLSDEAVGIKAHEKIDTSLKAKLIEEAIHIPYRSSGEEAAEAVKLTGQTVMNSIRELGSVKNNVVKIERKNKVVKILYIEADEDHVALQNGSSEVPKLVYVHEGRMQVGKDRFKLINPRYFSGVYSESDELWVEVEDYIDESYDMEAVEKIYLSGDGASWIINGLGWIKKSIYVLDRYHLSRYITQATAHIANMQSIMWRYINNGDKDKVKELFKMILSATETETKKKSVQDARRYILGNWAGIRNQYDADYGGCSAEGHVSHILSSRLSSRPLGWCKTGVDQMARLRAFEANGGVVYNLLMEKKRAAQKETRIHKISQAIIEKRKVTEINEIDETLGNLMILNVGKKAPISQFLKSIRNA